MGRSAKEVFAVKGEDVDGIAGGDVERAGDACGDVDAPVGMEGDVGTSTRAEDRQGDVHGRGRWML